MASPLDQAAETAKEVLKASGDFVKETGSKLGKGIQNQFDNISPTKDSDSVTTWDSSDSTSMDGYVLNEENQWGWITLYVVTIVIAVLANLLFVVASLCTKRTRTTGYYLLLNLSLRDILFACICVPFTLDSEIIAYTWNYGDIYCRVFRFSYYCFLFFLPLTLLFLAYHLFVENCKWNFAGEDHAVPRPWPHTIFIPMIWFFSLLFAVPTIFFTEVTDEEEDMYRNIIAKRPDESLVCLHAEGIYSEGSRFFYIASTILTFLLPLVLLFIPWWALLVQVFGCCTRKLRNSEFWLSIITLFLILIYEASRFPFELWNIHFILTNNEFFDLDDFIPGLDSESYKAVMKWAIYAPVLLNPLFYFTFSPEARHGVYILFTRMCSCCCSKGGDDVEVASDDEKGRMLGKENNDQHGNDASGVPLQSKQEEEM